ncbi:MAG: MOSC domain-containing protein [Alphaproteobacteria bacterium]
MTITVTNLYRYPVKGMAADELQKVELRKGGSFPFDRAYALAHASTGVNKTNPHWAPPHNFIMLKRDDKLAQLGLDFDEETTTLTVTRRGKPVSRGNLNDQMGKTVLESFLAGYLPQGPRGNPKILEAPEGVRFADREQLSVSIINLASLRDIERVMRRPIDPLRFRANIYIDGTPAWNENTWVGKTIRIGDVDFDVIEQISRCDATNVEPVTGNRDMNIPVTLQNGFGHRQCGIYARVASNGTISVGDNLVEP